MYEPRIVAFFCNWCTYTAADLAGTTRLKYAPNVRVIRVMCSGRVDPQFIMSALREGADGVLVGGCHPGDCHYQEGNHKTMRRFGLLKKMLKTLGVEKERVRLEWISASEGAKVKQVIDGMTEDLRKLGPLNLGIAPKIGAVGKTKTRERSPASRPANALPDSDRDARPPASTASKGGG